MLPFAVHPEPMVGMGANHFFDDIVLHLADLRNGDMAIYGQRLLKSNLMNTAVILPNAKHG